MRKVVEEIRIHRKFLNDNNIFVIATQRERAQDIIKVLDRKDRIKACIEYVARQPVTRKTDTIKNDLWRYYGLYVNEVL